MTSSSSPSRKVPGSPPPNPSDSPPGAAPRRWVFRFDSANNSIDPFSPVQALSKIACNRLQKELAEWQLNPPAGFKHKVSDNLQRCRLSPHPSLSLSLPAIPHLCLPLFFRIYVFFISPCCRLLDECFNQSRSLFFCWYLLLISRAFLDLSCFPWWIWTTWLIG